MGAGCVFGAAGWAGHLDQPLTLGDRSPFSQVHGLPAPRSGELLAPGQTETRLVFDVANNFVDAQSGTELMVLDGETQRLELGWRAGLGNGWEVGYTLPVLQHSGGNLDSFIEGWHDFWGLPDGGRPDAARNRLDYRYRRGGVVEVDLHERESGIGDAEIQAAYQLWRGGDTTVAMAATIKLPTGDAERLTGDGTAATDLTLAATTQNLWGSTLSGYANAGVLWLPAGDVLPAMQRDYIWHAGAGISWPVSWLDHEVLALKLQLDMHQAFYRSAVRALGNDSILLVIGGTARLAPHWLLDIGVGEDLAVDTAPDVTLQMGLRWID
ncbi:MAG: DUF3187 family protein [Spongiibacteraceae bacterium]